MSTQRSHCPLVATCLFLFIWLCSYAQADEPEIDVSYAKPHSKAEKRIKRFLLNAGLADDLVEFVNDEFKLKRDLMIRFQGNDGPLYDPKTSEIIIPYAFLLDIRETFAEGDYADSAAELDLATLDVLEHVLYHELGHALIDQFDLPILGKEEDAVDDLAVFLLLEIYEDGDDMALSAADAFWYSDDNRETFEAADYWGEHSLSIQRFYRTVCLIVGSNPNRYRAIARELELPRERQEICADEYEQQRTNWYRLLKRHLRKNGEIFADLRR